MIAVIESGGKQFKIKEGSYFQTEKIVSDVGQKIILSKILVASSSSKTVLGDPYIKNASVECEVIENGKHKKILIFKKIRRKNHRRKNGHRQHFTMLKVNKINL